MHHCLTVISLIATSPFRRGLEGLTLSILSPEELSTPYILFKSIHRHPDFTEPKRENLTDVRITSKFYLLFLCISKYQELKEWYEGIK